MEQSAPAEEGFRVGDIVTLWKVPSGTVYWLANKHSWRRYKVCGRVHYHPQDVLDTLG